jgi:uncharacterized protein DUF2158
VKKIYDLIIRIPVFQADDGTLVGEAQTVLPKPAPGAPGAPDAVETTPRAALVDAVDAIVEFATGNSVLILGEDTTPHLEQMRAMLSKHAAPDPLGGYSPDEIVVGPGSQTLSQAAEAERQTTFKTGDVVRLKSGSRPMTVVHVNDDLRVTVAHEASNYHSLGLDNERGIHRDLFPALCLELNVIGFNRPPAPQPEPVSTDVAPTEGGDATPIEP